MVLDAPAWIAVNVFTGATLLALSVTLLAGARRSGDAFLLALFLGLVGVNYLGIGMGQPVASLPWGIAAYAALALDPFYLLAFVTAYPYRRRGPLALALLATSAILSVVSFAIVVLFPHEVLAGFVPGARYDSLWRLPTVANLALAYGASWILAVLAVRDAPSPTLARRAGWLVVAVGVATLPRLGHLPQDFGFNPGRWPFVGDDPFTHVIVQVTIFTALAALAFACGAWIARGSKVARGPVRAAGLAAIAILAGELVAWTADTLGSISGASSAIPYAFRWLVFAGVLVYGILAYDVVEFRRFATRAALPLGALVGGLATYFASRGFFGDPTTPFLLGVFAAPLAALAARASVARVASREDDGVSRRLELYRAALEAAWARGPPDEAAERGLERDRRAFGVTPEEARALVHVVSRPAFARASSVEPGREIAPGLVLEREIGSGAHGRVFVANRYSRGDRVVAKILHADEADGRDNRRRLLAELRALDGLDHPNVVKLLEVHAVDGLHVLVMELVEGRTLADALAEKALSPAAATRAIGDVLAGLDAVHARGVVHRDVKPANVIVTPGGRAVVADFGVAEWAGAARVRATVESFASLGSVAGTLQYMAPEQARGDPATPATDVYAVGLVAYEALTGKPALDLRALSVPRALAKVAEPSIDLAGVPRRWKPVLARALAPDPRDRFPSARAMRDAVAALAPSP